MAFWLTDETFAVAMNRYNRKDPLKAKHWYYLGSAIFMYTNWSLCTLLGLKFGQVFPDLADWGLDFAMPATFIGMLIPYLHERPMWFVVIISGLAALATNSIPHKLGIMLAALAGVSTGIAIEILCKTRRGV